MNKRLSFIAFFISLFFITWTSYTFILDVPYSSKRLAEGFILVLGAISIHSSGMIQQQWLSVLKKFDGKVKIALGLFLGIGIISSILANYTAPAFLQVSHYFLIFNLIILAAVGYQYKPRNYEIGLLSVIGLMAGLYLVNVAISYLYIFFIHDFPLWPNTDFIRVWFKNIGFMYPEPFLNFVNIRFFNHLQTWTLPLLSLLVVYIPKRYWAFSKISFLILCGWWMLAFASDARGTLVASFIALGFVFFMYRHKAKQWLRTHSLTAVIGFVLYGLIFQLPQLSGAGGGRTAFSDYSDEGRLEIWEHIINVIWKNPLFGLGPMHFPRLEESILKGSHNIYLQFSVEWGFIAGILFIAIVGASFYYWVTDSNKSIESSAINSTEVNVRVALTASLSAALIHGLVSGIINSPLSQMMMVLVVGWMIGLTISDDNKEESISNGLWKRAGLMAVNLLAAGFLMWSYYIQVPNLDENRQKYIQITKKNRLTPRYWDQGVIGLEKKDNELNEHSASE